MISISRPVKGEDFIDRIDLLKQIKASYPVDNIALIGLRRIGKSSIAEQFILKLTQKNTIKFRFNVQGNMGTPGKFALRLLRSFLIAYFDQHKNITDPGLDEIDINPGWLTEAALKINSKTLARLSRFLGTYFPPSPDDERAVLERILVFLDDFSVEAGVKTAIVLDEFQAIIELDRYKAFKNGQLLGFLEDIISRQENVWYMFTGSAVRMMNNILESPDSPFYGRVKRFNIQAFSKDDTAKLAHKCANKPITAEALNFLFNLAGGHPFYTVVIIRSAITVSDHNPIITRRHLEEAFISELAGGALDSHCNYLFETSLGRAKQNTFLKEVLRILSDGEATVTELAKRAGRSSGYLSLPIRNLYNLDLIERRNKRYGITDNILALWIRTVHGYIEPDLKKIKRKIKENYQEYIAALSTEAGIFFESYLREMLQKFNGQRFAGFRLPKFQTVDGLNAFDAAGEVFGKSSNIEIDAFCQGEENWICEFKYRKRSVGKKDIDQLTRKKDFLADKMNVRIDKMMVVSKSGFSEYALKSDVWCITLRELDGLPATLNMRAISRILKANEV